jgi:hypothetical protein
MLCLSLVTKKHTISQGCAVDNYTYYCEVTYDRADIKPGVYSFNSQKNSRIGYNRLITVSDKVWRQGPKGGVKIVKDRTRNYMNYVTSDEKMMKKFIWIKLKAQSIK